jgi:signal transduction histidine kinase
VRKFAEFGAEVRSLRPASVFDRLLAIGLRHHAAVLLFVMCCGIAVIGGFVVIDLRTANLETREDYVRSVHGLERIGELQYDAQETRRATLYALTTSDSNLQVQYADQSRDADKRVTDAIAEYGSHANQPTESAAAARLLHDWANYLAIRDDVLASILEGSTKEAVSLDLSGGVPAFERVRQDLYEVKRLYDQDASKRQAELAASSSRSVSRLIGILSFTFLLSSAAVWAIQRSQMLSTIQLAKLQMEFVASVSHELRTPLAVLMSAADNLADGLVEGEAALQRYGAIVRHQSRSIGDLVDQILLFASTEDSKKQYFVEPLEVAPLMAWIVSSTEGVVKEAGATLELQSNAGVVCILGNRTGILQCMQNLIGNAVKYGGTDRHIVLRASAVPSGNGSGAEVHISVTDHGIGIEPSELPHIFEPFYRSPRVRAAQIHGTGLGLSLAKRIAESMGGGLSVVSEQSVGSTFTLRLRIAKGGETFKEALHPSPTPL